MILFIDDEPRIMDSYRRYLEFKMEPEGYSIEFHSNVDDALRYFELHYHEIDLIILDIMMPAGKAFSSDNTNGGLKTGLLFYQNVREVSQDIPVMFFTNFFDSDLEKQLGQDSKCWFLQKVNYLLDDFVGEVKAVLSNASN